MDIEVAKAEVEAAISAVKKAQTELNQSYIRAPITGQILKIHTRPEEEISADGILDMGETQQMEAVAEIYQSDINKQSTHQLTFLKSNTSPVVTVRDAITDLPILAAGIKINFQIAPRNNQSKSSGLEIS